MSRLKAGISPNVLRDLAEKVNPYLRPLHDALAIVRRFRAFLRQRYRLDAL